MNNGFIKLHRSMMEWEWIDDHNTFRLFIFMLFLANHKPKKWKGIDVNRGQFVSGLHSLSTKTGLSVRQIRTAISHLKSTGELTSKTTNKYTLYTIENYSKYQDKTVEATSKTTGKETNERQATDNKQECKEVKKEEKRVSRFTPPTLEQVSNYCFERGNLINPQDFIDHYQANGWMRGKTKIKDWKACVRTWEKTSLTNQPEFNEGNYV